MRILIKDRVLKCLQEHQQLTPEEMASDLKLRPVLRLHGDHAHAAKLRDQHHQRGAADVPARGRGVGEAEAADGTAGEEALVEVLQVDSWCRLIPSRFHLRRF